MSDMDFDFGAEYAAFGEDLKGVAYEGDYDMRVKKAVAGRTQKGKMRITVTLAFTSGPHAAKNREVTDNLIWSPESEVAARIFSNNLKVMGASQDWIMQARPTPQQICDQITGSVVSVTLKKDEFNGQPQTRVNYKKTVSSKAAGAVQGGAVAAGTAAAAAVSLDEDEQVDTTTGEVKEPATVGASAPAGEAASEDPWAEG